MSQQQKTPTDTLRQYSVQDRASNFALFHCLQDLFEEIGWSILVKRSKKAEMRLPNPNDFFHQVPIGFPSQFPQVLLPRSAGSHQQSAPTPAAGKGIREAHGGQGWPWAMVKASGLA